MNHNSFEGARSSGQVAHPEAERSLARAIADDLIASVEIPECSVAASDTAETAEEIFNYEPPKHHVFTNDKVVETVPGVGAHTKQCHNILLTDNEFLAEDALLKWVGSEVEVSPGRKVRLALARRNAKKPKNQQEYEAQELNHLRLLAITRENIAFPLVRFSRSDQVFCDHIQFWGEEDGDELQSSSFYSWGGDDNGSRFDTVQTLAAILEGKDDSDLRLTRSLLQQLKLTERMQAKLGPTSPELEELVSEVFSSKYKDGEHTFTQEYCDQPFGRVVTDITVEGKLSPIDHEPDKRLFSIRRFPSSQANRNWESRMFVINRRAGVHPADESLLVRDLDLQIMLGLITDQQERNVHMAGVDENSSKKTTFFDRFVVCHGISILTLSGVRSAYNVVNSVGFEFSQFVPGVTGPAAIAGVTLATISSVRAKRRASRDQFGGEEEEI